MLTEIIYGFLKGVNPFARKGFTTYTGYGILGAVME